MPTGSPTIGVLALQGDVREHLAALKACGAHGCLVRRPGELDGLDGLIVPGGESTTMGKLADSFGLLQPLRKLAAADFPIYGSCAGMIMLARRILDGRADQLGIGGLDVTVRRNAFGRQSDSFEADVDFAGVAGAPVRGVFIRAPWVEQVGARVRVLGSVEHPGAGGGAARRRVVAVRSGRLLATSFHPELTGDVRVHALFVRIASGG